MLVLSASAVGAAEDDYLRAVEEEAQRVEMPRIENEAATSSDEAEVRGSRADFEAELKQYRGTYSFYQALMEKDKAEVYKAYREGASFSRLRRMIISRKLNR